MLFRLLDTLAELSVVASYTSWGYSLRHRRFQKLPMASSTSPDSILITGANSGIGYATTKKLASLGHHIIMLCRNLEKAKKAKNAIEKEIPNAKLSLEQVDMSDLNSIRAFETRLVAMDKYPSILIHNAGALLDQRRFSPQGIEITMATHVVGPQLLSKIWSENSQCHAGSKLIFVSSGGMYTQKIKLSYLMKEEGHFDGVVQYAQAKRAQVILSDMWAERLLNMGITVNSMHPGWARTPGVATALPRFNRILDKILRSPEQGADTVVWLATTDQTETGTGNFFLDRSSRTKHVFPWTRSPDSDKKQLWETVSELANRE